MLGRILMGVVFVILPLIIVGAILFGSISLIGLGINYWTDVSGIAYDKSADFALQSYGKGTVIYPEFIRPAATQKIEVEFTPSGAIAANTVISVTVREGDSFLTVAPTVLTTTLTSASAPVPLKFDIITRNPKIPPKHADIDVEAYDTAGQKLGHASVQLTVNAWTGKLISVAAALGGIIGVLATALGLIKTLPNLIG